MKVVVTGSSGGIGSAIVKRFAVNHEVIGLDIKESEYKSKNFTHITADITKELPNIEGVEVLINNAGVQDSGNDIAVNLAGTMKVTEKYLSPKIKSVVFVASASASTGSEFPEYAASKGGIISYMKNIALRIAKYGAISNSISPGGVLTSLNDHIIKDKKLWNDVMNETPLKKWATAEEIAEWVYFVAVINRSMTAQDIIVDNGESAKANFIW